MAEIQGQIVTENGLVAGRLVLENERIAQIERIPSVSSTQIILPGFIDLHCHGGGGADIMDAGDSPHKVARHHAITGTTSFLATTMTAPLTEIKTTLKAVDNASQAQAGDEAGLLGVHLEGPFISRDKLGAQPDCVLMGDIALMTELMKLATIRVVTCAPEADPEGTMSQFLSEQRVRVQVGHSCCDYETARKSFANGRQGVTHMFNAMTPLHHRAPGIVGAALAHAKFAEIIPDLLHVHPGAILAALRAIPGLYAVTDASPASGMPDGDYRLGTQKVKKCGNGVRLTDGTLAGSSLTMLQAFRNLVSIGLSIEEASRRTSTIAANYLNLCDRGRIAKGAIADLVVLDQDLTLKSVVVRGEPLK